MRLLDLFCGAGGAAEGYRRAGFDEIVGVDLAPQPSYPFEFVQADALEFLAGGGDDGFDAIHASPPCQAYSRATSWRGDRSKHPDLVAQTVQLLRETELPFAVENVPEAPLPGAVTLCGSMFGLRVRRHRLFLVEPMPDLELLPPCHHVGLLPFEHKGERAYADAMGCYWMSSKEARQAIPPAYTEHIGRSMLAAMTDGTGRIVAESIMRSLRDA